MHATPSQVVQPLSTYTILVEAMAGWSSWLHSDYSRQDTDRREHAIVLYSVSSYLSVDTIKVIKLLYYFAEVNTSYYNDIHIQFIVNHMVN